MTKITSFSPSHKGTSSKNSKKSKSPSVREGVASVKNTQQPKPPASATSLSKRSRVGEQREVDELLSHLNDDDDTESLGGSAANNQVAVVSGSSASSINHSDDDCVSVGTGSWKKALAKHFESANFASLAKFVAAERALSTAHNDDNASCTTSIYPAAADTWAALNACPLHAVKVVIVGQDPYHGPGQAHGLCFSVLPGQAAPPSLKNIYKELSEDPDISFPAQIPKHGHLLHWAQQGVLLLNTVLTVRKGQANSHKKKGWELVTDEIIRAVDRRARRMQGGNNGGCVFLLWGIPATAKALQLIGRSGDDKKDGDDSSSSSPHTIICTSHPSPLGARKTDAPFLGSRCFSRCNQALEKMGHEPIDWNVDGDL